MTLFESPEQRLTVKYYITIDHFSFPDILYIDA